MPLEDGETQPDYPRPPCATSFFKSGLIRILHQYFTHSLYVYAGETIMPPRAKTLRAKTSSQSSHVSVARSPSCPSMHSADSPHSRGVERRATGNETLIRHVIVSSDLAISYRVSRSQAIFPLNWVSEKSELSLKLGRSQARVGVLYLERSDYYLVERH